MASPVLPAPSTGFTSDQLTPATVYTRAQLRTLFAIADASLDASVFRPSGYRSVWLFATASLIGSSGTDALMLDQDTLQWAGQPAGRTNQLIITHELRGLELLVFYRASPAQYPSEGFRYPRPIRVLQPRRRPPRTLHADALRQRPQPGADSG